MVRWNEMIGYAVEEARGDSLTPNLEVNGIEEK
jgi:hypothetical protein